MTERVVAAFMRHQEFCVSRIVGDNHRAQNDHGGAALVEQGGRLLRQIGKHMRGDAAIGIGELRQPHLDDGNAIGLGAIAEEGNAAKKRDGQPYPVRCAQMAMLAHGSKLTEPKARPPKAFSRWSQRRHDIVIESNSSIKLRRRIGAEFESKDRSAGESWGPYLGSEVDSCKDLTA
jgi:hypothetical protein